MCLVYRHQISITVACSRCKIDGLEVRVKWKVYDTVSIKRVYDTLQRCNAATGYKASLAALQQWQMIFLCRQQVASRLPGHLDDLNLNLNLIG